MSANTLSPYFTKQKAYRILVTLVCLLVILLGILAFFAPAGIDPDPCYGFLVMHCMERGGPFNIGLTPDPLNMAKDHAEFLAWWSPGQYLLPYFFKHLFNTNTGQAVALTTLVCELLGIVGYYQLFKKLGFSNWIAAISIAFMVSQLYFLALFTYYTGGEILIFGFMGWFLYGCFSIKKITWPVLVFVFLGGLMGFFCKSSVLWMYAASVACIWINVSMGETFDAHGNFRLLQIIHNKKIFTRWLLNGILLAIPFVCALAFIYVFYLSKGQNPTSTQGAILLKPETFLYPLSSPMVSGFSVDDLVDGLLYQPDGPKISYHSTLLLLSVFTICCLAFMAFITKIGPDKKYARVIIAFYTIACLFFGYMYLKQAEISYEGRHFRIIGILFTPGLIYLLFKTKATRVAFFLVWAAFIYWGYHIYHNNYTWLKRTPRGTSGLSQEVYDKATVDTIVKLDKENRNCIFVVTGSDIAMEVTHNRVLVIDDDNNDADIIGLRNAGKGGTLFILTPNRYIKTGRRENINKTFVDYHHFELMEISKDYSLTVAKD